MPIHQLDIGRPVWYNLQTIVINNALREGWQMEELATGAGLRLVRVPIRSARPNLTQLVEAAESGEVCVITVNEHERCALVPLFVARAGLSVLAADADQRQFWEFYGGEGGEDSAT